jgi:L-ribulokinase
MTYADKFVVGIDFGTLSGRALIVRVSDGEEISSATFTYPHGVVDRQLPGHAVELPPDWALQVPNDYIEVLRHAVKGALASGGVDPSSIIGIGTDFTACTVLPTMLDGTPLSEVEGFEAEPHAYAKLWKHHSAQSQADRINNLAVQEGEKWLSRYGGKISSEWEFAKALQILEEAPHVYKRAERWVEASDWIVWKLTGTYLRNISATGYKAIYQDNAYPSVEFLQKLNPEFSDFVERLVTQEVGQLGEVAGYLTSEAAGWTGLPEGIPVCVGNVDAHVTAASAQAMGNGQMVAIMGTSTCHVINHDKLVDIPGICGVVKGGITPGQWGYEAGQSGVGDIFNWLIENLVSDSDFAAAKNSDLDIHGYFSHLASLKAPGFHGLVALDWVNGNRSVLVDHNLSGVVIGLTMSTKASDLYSAFVESTAFGTRKILEAFETAGVEVRDFIAAGGLIKNKYLMQIYADVLNRPIHLLESEQGPALGSAIHAAVAAGAYPNILVASEKMGRLTRNAFVPRKENLDRVNFLYQIYEDLHNYFGDGEMMHSLRSLREI